MNEARGSTLEVVISRMKARGSSVRFILVSATVPNIRDVAAWIGKGSSQGPATVLEVINYFASAAEAILLISSPVWRRVSSLQADKIRVRRTPQERAE